MAELDLQTARWLTSSAGLDAVASAVEAMDTGRELLGVSDRFRRAGLSASRTSAVLGAADARRRARGRWRQTEQILFTRGGWEQASDPAVSAWRAARFTACQALGTGSSTSERNRVWDLGAGVGGDAVALAASGASVTAVDVDPARLVLLEHNARVLGVTLETLVGDALSVSPPPDALIHADPSRRSDDGRRLRALAEYRPPVRTLLERHSRAPGFGVVLSPAVDTHDPDLPEDVELEFVQVGDDLVESVVWGGALRQDDVVATATLLPEGLQRHRTSSDPPRLAVGPVVDHLVEVVPAAVRARLHDEIGGEVGAHRVADVRALLTVGEPPPPSPWYRSRQVVTVLPARPRSVRRWLRAGDHGPVELVLHGLRADPTQWWRDLGRPPRGPNGIRVELVRNDEGAIAVVTRSRPQR